MASTAALTEPEAVMAMTAVAGYEQLHLGDQLQALVAGRRQIDQEDVGGVAPQQASRLGQIGGGLHRVAERGGDLTQAERTAASDRRPADAAGPGSGGCGV
jgi:hypothetical protein